MVLQLQARAWRFVIVRDKRTQNLLTKGGLYILHFYDNCVSSGIDLYCFNVLEQLNTMNRLEENADKTVFKGIVWYYNRLFLLQCTLI